LQRKASAVERAGLSGAAQFKTRAEGEGTGDGLTLSGVAAVFNKPTIINSWEGHFREQLANGSWRKTLREMTPVMQFDHGEHASIGSLPIGYYTRTAEENDGVAVEGRLFKAPIFEPVREGIAAQAIRGMSFRFEVIRDKWVTPDGKVLRDNEEILRAIYTTPIDADEGELMTRTIQEVRVPEMGPVVFPAYAETSVDVRSRAVVIDLGGTREAQISQLKRAQDQLAEMIKQLDAKERAAPEPRAGHSTEVEPPEEHSEDEVDSEEAEPEPRVEHSAPEAEPPEEHSAERQTTDIFDEARARIQARMAKIRKETPL